MYAALAIVATVVKNLIDGLEVFIESATSFVFDIRYNVAMPDTKKTASAICLSFFIATIGLLMYFLL